MALRQNDPSPPGPGNSDYFFVTAAGAVAATGAPAGLAAAAFALPGGAVPAAEAAVDAGGLAPTLALDLAFFLGLRSFSHFATTLSLSMGPSHN